VQAAGRIGIDFKALGVDYLTLSAHKFGGPQGVGALIFREGLQMPKFMKGGGQEKRQRAGTENVAAIHGFGLAAKLALENLAAYQSACSALRARLEQGLRQLANDLVIASENAPRVANTTNVIVPGVSSETQLMGMDLEGIAVSSGSACSSGTFKPSHVLTAMGYSDEDSRSALRFSTGWATTEADIDAAVAAYGRILARVRK
jgi:cysteine desulfurase